MDLLEKMSTFVRVVEAGSLSAAAKQLRISPAAVSRQIATLETEVRAVLLARTTRSMALTAAGREYYTRCVRILSDVEDAQTALRGDPMDGPLSISAPVTFGTARVIPHLVAFRRRHPRIRLDLRLEDRLVDPVSENVDVLLRVGGLPSEALVAHRLMTFSRILVASPAYLRARGEPKTPEALAKHCVLAHTRGDGHQQLSLQKEGRTTSTMMSVVFRSNSLFALRQLAIAGDGVALLPDWLVENEVERRSLRVVLPGWNGEPFSAYAMHRVELRGAPRVRAFIDYLREVLA
jgi:DNA-binding transcriptional LysR family regulator